MKNTNNEILGLMFKKKNYRKFYLKINQQSGMVH